MKTGPKNVEREEQVICAICGRLVDYSFTYEIVLDRHSLQTSRVCDICRERADEHERECED
jgi:hypothetical protein